LLELTPTGGIAMSDDQSPVHGPMITVSRPGNKAKSVKVTYSSRQSLSN
jgi:hypothetical protein